MHFIEDGFESAAENMAFDAQLAATDSIKPVFRLYTWPKRGLTFGHKQMLPPDLQDYDSGRRMTGGGIVFHNPYDLVLSCTATLKDPLFPKTLKNKMHWFSEFLRARFSECGVSLSYAQLPKTADFAFCNTYHNPYELMYAGEKIVALTLRKLRYRFIVQGVLHLSSNYDTFPELVPTYGPYFSEGLPSDFQGIATRLRKTIQQALV